MLDRISQWIGVMEVHGYLIWVFTAMMKQHKKDATGYSSFDQGLSYE